VQTTIDFEITRTNRFTYASNLLESVTDERGLVTTNFYDNLQRLVRRSFPNGSSTNVYANLDLVKAIDRMNFTNSFGYDGLRRMVAVTNAIGNYTIFSYCSCGSLDSITDAEGNITSFFYDGAGRMTNVVYPNNVSVTNYFNLIGQVTNTVNAEGVTSLIGSPWTETSASLAIRRVRPKS